MASLEQLLEKKLVFYFFFNGILKWEFTRRKKIGIKVGPIPLKDAFPDEKFTSRNVRFLTSCLNFLIFSNSRVTLQQSIYLHELSYFPLEFSFDPGVI